MIVSNKHARRNYELLEFFECGIVLKGTEVKSISRANCSINEAYVQIVKNEALILNMHVASFFEGNNFNQDPYRNRKLLLHKKEIIKLQHLVQTQRMTIVPTKIYWKNNKLKVEIALAKGKQLHDKREDLKKRDLARESRLF
ncbi:SsrA-binding protein SmpB [Ureaplasma urealyticum]|uniref:SsrA-binding protein n=3 Tax=Ureaplasma urealyticum TaxID=2130 RepID=A0AAP9A9I1_UREUR|nr:SsrA-binding protein SmpB [Ureaplasma urealyticum]EDX54149.1 SsrA-binding protein [Ureaplasma urealyticum serovar 9 str. ATCC 33175]ACI59793.1 SsrA-binding protein [Ureaplasma urealyticum serovar 10 str. ATCC 33699]EDT49663.1 SsrA-binding protein [Ureaplasma urealyticum serovar 13 str. ATCC 33698]EDU06396.1 SsrA-binding protein [Ureaplasma urealyticum serovar 5 str. ATCC 27817]EDU56701.1 SsrA-binding protein [Ureaplasma urealyticum serovar 7 str. ATCC 27819]